MKKILTIVGARPQFVKAAVVSRAFREHAGYGSRFIEKIIHTGQHYDKNMSDVFFEEMEIPKPDYNLGVGGKTHGAMTGQMLEKLEELFLKEKPDMVLVYGDTNSTLSGALAATKLHIPVSHVEAGLRSFNRKMPEEINRILTDQISNLLFCPSELSLKQLSKEGIGGDNSAINQFAVNTGDVMYDAVKFYLKKLDIENVAPKKPQMLVTLHRAENVDQKNRFSEILSVLKDFSNSYKILLPLHPRTRKMAELFGLNFNGIHVVEPLGYFDLLRELKNSTLVASDSGGLQKESFFAERPCLVLRDETEWTELLETGNNILCGAKKDKIQEGALVLARGFSKSTNPYGNGDSGKKIVMKIIDYIS